jgi:hypothetical protein
VPTHNPTPFPCPHCGCEVTPPQPKRRSLPANRRYWALLTCAAESLGWDDPIEALHEELAHLILSLPPVNGLRRRMRTPKLTSHEFTVYMDRVEAKLIDLGADLSDWGEHERRQERAA